MIFNPIAALVAALSTFLVGFIWYNPKVFGTAWMSETGMTDEKAKKGNMAKIFGLTFILSVIMSFFLPLIVIHQSGVLQIVNGDATNPAYMAYMEVVGNNHRSLGHGALHGFMTGLMLVLPAVAINSLFEQKSWKYILITGGYWVVSLTIMGAVICGWK